jgi:hypothetical protein
VADLALTSAGVKPSMADPTDDVVVVFPCRSFPCRSFPCRSFSFSTIRDSFRFTHAATASVAVGHGAPAGADHSFVAVGSAP